MFTGDKSRIQSLYRKLLGYTFRNMATVEIEVGCSIQGKEVILKSEPKFARPIHAFKGVPYAKCPDRFEPTQPFEPWHGIRDATKFGAICPQNTVRLVSTPLPIKVPDVQSEDCLFLNIWTPRLGDEKLPVMFYIHGGAYVEGYSNLYQGISLCTFQDVVFVSINYRLGPFGFLCTGDSESCGNYGLLDQIEALKWVKRYIKNFGGDPENITIFGESAGGMSVSNLVLSPLTKGLFKRAISESGVSTSGSFLWTPERARRYLNKQLPKMGCKAENSKEVIEFLRKLPADELWKQLGEGFRPVIDGHVVLDWPRNVYEDSKHHHVDYMLGCNSHEGAMFVFGAQALLKTEVKETARVFMRQYAGSNFRYNVDQITDLSLEEYIPQKRPSKTEVLKGLIDFVNDLTFFISTREFANMHSKTCPTYVYHFDHRPQISPYPEWVKADHAMEILYVLGTLFIDMPGLDIDDSEKQLCRDIMQIWANFANTGNPSTEQIAWPKYNNIKEPFVLLNSNPEVKNGLPYRTDFWESIFSKYDSDSVPQAKY